jgi:ubiquinone/menaquinone biosynthesis C-methylase UbiE
MSDYDNFAPCYDELIKASKDGVHGRYDRLLKVYAGDAAGKILLDIGCGTGELSEHFAALGYDVIGTDISSEMLNIAAKKRSGKQIQYLSQNVLSLDLYGTVDIAIAARDTLNHLKNIAELQAAIEKTAFFLNPGGLFIFDFNTSHKHREKLSGKTYFYETENTFCAWDNSDCGDRIKMSLTIFKKNPDGHYRRFNTEIFEFTAEIKTVSAILKKCGFGVKVFDFDNFSAPTEQTEKVVFIARKS